MIHVSALGGGRARLVTGFDGPVAEVAEELARLAADEVPSVAAIAGHCVGPAFELALACDLRLAADSAIVSADGVVDVTGCARRLARLLGEARAKDLLLTGRAVGAAEALRLGVVTRVVPAAGLDAAARAAAELIGAGAPLAVRAARHAIARVRDLTPAQALAEEHDHVRRLIQTRDHTTAVAAFLAHRPATFTGE
ncbi:MAG: enoyl-CoA hydratase [Candidatus Rokubacteria bacterium]|nr:enoyl-CoA hydratase [Candidatus Rokubacteria bacterium]